MRRELLLTTSWDDGHPRDFRIAEMLEHYGLTGTFYVPRRAETKVMSTPQIQELGKHFEIGAHTLDHVRLHDIPMAEARRQMSASRSWVQDITGKPCVVFCFPGGKFQRKHLPLLTESGFVAARTVEMMSLAGAHPLNGLALLPTTIQAHPHSMLTYVGNAAKRWRAKNVWHSLIHRGNDWAMTAINLLDCARRQGGVFHLWGHSWEIEETGQWERLERVLAAMGECKHEAESITNGELWQKGGRRCQ